VFQSREIKHSRLLLRHSEKFLRYKRDVLEANTRDSLTTDMNELRAALAARDRERIHTSSVSLDQKLHKLSPPHWEMGWRENCEVILVALVVAVAVRSYFIQPFKIPTGSMQPTLNGIIGHPTNAPAPNILHQIAEFFVLGRNYINVVAQQDERIEQVIPQKYLFFFTWSRVITDRGTHLIYAPPDTLKQDFHVFPGNRYKRGDVVARGAVDTGDQVFVDKFSYNFIKPQRGNVFVFRTTHIVMLIPEDPETGAPFFIKRLAGRPGDTLRIDPPLLYINGKPAEGYGFERVMSAKFPYRGYSLGREYLATRDQTFTVPPHSYFAMGDNSYSSYDSRYWGPVPEENVVGCGLMVYWPFNRHWGFIR